MITRQHVEELLLESAWAVRLVAPNSSTSSASQTSTGSTRIGSFWGNPKTRSFAELLIDCEEDRTLRAVLIGMLAEMERK